MLWFIFCHCFFHVQILASPLCPFSDVLKSFSKGISLGPYIISSSFIAVRVGPLLTTKLVYPALLGPKHPTEQLGQEDLLWLTVLEGLTRDCLGFGASAHVQEYDYSHLSRWEAERRVMPLLNWLSLVSSSIRDHSP